MHHPSKAYQELIEENALLRQRIQELEISESEGKRSEEALPDSAERYRSLVDNVDFGINLISKDFKILTTNVISGKQFNKPASELIGKNCFKEFEKRQAVCRHCPGVQAMATGRPHQVDTVGLRDDGSSFLARIHAFPLFYPDGTIRGFNEVVEDITEREQAEEKLRLSEAQYRTIFENTGTAMVVLDEDTTISLANTEFEHLTGYSKEEIEGKKSWTEFTLKEDLEKQMAQHKLRRVQPGSAKRNYEFRLVNKSGQTRDIHLTIDMIPDTKKSIASLLDITERKQAEDKFSNVFMMAPDGISVTRMSDGLIIDTNLGFTEISGWERDEIIGRTSLEVNFWDDPADRVFLVEELKAGRDVLNREFQCRRKDGSVRTGIYSARLTYISDEACIIFLMQDITRRKETERALQEKEDRLYGITKNMPGTVFQFFAKDNGEYVISYISERIMELLNLPPDADTSLQALLSHIHDEDRDALMNSIRHAIETCSSWNYEGRFIKPSGKTMWFHGLASPKRHKDALVFDGIMLNITERKHAEEMSRQSEEKFHKIFMTTPDCIAITRMKDGLILDANEGHERILGWKHSEVVGKRSSLENNFWDDPADRDAMIKELKAGRDVLHREFQFRRRDGSLRTGIYSARPIVIDGEACLIFVLHDITDQRQLEQQLIQSRKMESIGTLAGGIAHDFNNLLMGIQGHASLMMLDLDPSHPHHARLKHIEEQVKSGADLTKQLLGFARGGRYAVRPTDMNDIVKKTSEMFGRTKKEITIHRKFREDLWTVEVDRTQMEQVFMNLYVNAWHAMPSGGEIFLETGNLPVHDEGQLSIAPGKYVKITVSDTGTGMDAQTRERIFEPFFTTKGMGRGTGLGLATVYGIIKGHGGLIDVTSIPGQGTTFDIYLPATEKAVVSEEAVKKDVLRGTETILLVDDEAMVLDVAKGMLEFLGYRVHCAGSGQEAVAVYTIKKNEIDLVILDMILPGISGGETFDHLREINPQAKVLLSSGYSIDGNAREILERGCDGFLQKPFQIEQLAREVRAILDMKADGHNGLKEIQNNLTA